MKHSLMKDSGVEWIGEIPENWTISKSKYFLSHFKNIVGRHADEYDRLALTLNGVIKRPKDDDNGLQPTDFETYQILRKNQLVFKLIDLQNVSTSRVGLSPYDGIVSPAYIVLDIGNRINSKYAEKYFLVLWYRQIFNQLGDDGVRSSLNVGDLLDIPITIPPLDEQTKIASFLDSKTSEIKSLIDNLNKQIESLKEYKKSLIYKCVTKGLDDSVPLKDSGIEWIGEIPENWNIVKLKINYDFINGFAFDSNLLSLDGKYPIIRIGDFTETYIDFKNANKIDDNSLLDKYLVKSNDILIAMSGATVGKLVQITNLDKECYINQRVGIIRAANAKILPRYVYYSLFTVKFLEYINLLSAGSAQPNISGDEILNYPICFKDYKSQIFICNYLDKECLNIDHLISSKQQTIEKLSEYQKSLIYEYVTGKKEVITED